MVYIAVDDTDSITGMCTTYLASELMLELDELDVIGYPRLVRLNPNIPWKTRGNAAITLQLGRGTGRRFPVAEVYGTVRYAFPRGTGEMPRRELRAVASRAEGVIMGMAVLGDERTNPGLVVSNKKPPQSLYWNAVRQVVEKRDVERELERVGCVWRGLKNGRGIIGASAAMAWRPTDRTFEVIAYRERGRWGTGRELDEERARSLDKRFPSTFNNFDARNRHMTVAPSTPCPVLFGIRGEGPGELTRAKDWMRGEPVDRWVLFESNQGTDQHLVRVPLSRVAPHMSVKTIGIVTMAPERVAGGHVFLSITDGRGELDCAAFEPTKEFRETVLELLPGDKVEVWGGVKEPEGKRLTINIEKLRPIKLVDKRVKTGNPRCPECGRGMKSIGAGQGYRCRPCGTRAGESDATFKSLQRGIHERPYEVPVCARRHLSKPLKRYRGAF